MVEIGSVWVTNDTTYLHKYVNGTTNIDRTEFVAGESFIFAGEKCESFVFAGPRLEFQYRYIIIHQTGVRFMVPWNTFNLFFNPHT